MGDVISINKKKTESTNTKAIVDDEKAFEEAHLKHRKNQERLAEERKEQNKKLTKKLQLGR